MKMSGGMKKMNLRFHNTQARHRTIPSLKIYFTGISNRVKLDRQRAPHIDRGYVYQSLRFKGLYGDLVNPQPSDGNSHGEGPVSCRDRVHDYGHNQHSISCAVRQPFAPCILVRIGNRKRLAWINTYSMKNVEKANNAEYTPGIFCLRDTGWGVKK